MADAPVLVKLEPPRSSVLSAHGVDLPRVQRMSRQNALWRVISLALGGFLCLYAAGYLPRGDAAASGVYNVIREWGGVRAHSTVMAAVGVGVLFGMWTRGAFVTMTLAAMFCGWTVVALYMGYRDVGFGWGGWVTFAFVGFIATVLAWFAPSYAWSPARRWQHAR